jgi:hypothetical protein
MSEIRRRRARVIIRVALAMALVALAAAVSGDIVVFYAGTFMAFFCVALWFVVREGPSV